MFAEVRKCLRGVCVDELFGRSHPLGEKVKMIENTYKILGRSLVLMFATASASLSAQVPWNDVDRASVDAIVSQSKYASSSEKLRVVDLDLAGIKSLVSGAQAKGEYWPYFDASCAKWWCHAVSLSNPLAFCLTRFVKSIPLLLPSKVMLSLTLRLLFDSS